MDLKFNYPVWHDAPYVDEWGRTRPRDFFDQTVQLQHILTALDAARALPTAIIVGDRRAGKTSLLKLAAGRLAVSSASGVRPLTIRSGGIGSCAEWVQEIVYTISSRIGRDMPAPAESAPTPSLAATLRGLLTGGAERIILCVDEFDAVLHTAGAEAAAILSQLAGLRAAPALPLALLLTMSDYPDAGVCAALGDPAVIGITPFSVADTAGMVEALLQGSRLVLPLAEMGELHYLSGGWPYYTKLLLTYLAQQPTLDLGAALAEAADDANVDATLNNIYKMRWDDAEKAVMLLCAAGAEPITATRLAAQARAWVPAADRLVARHYLTQDTEGEYRLRIPFLGTWLRAWAEFDEQVALHVGLPAGPIQAPGADPGRR